MAPLRLRIDGRTFRDPANREVTLHGINVAGDAKFPAVPDQPSNVPDDFFDGDNVSFVGRPFSADDAHVHFARLKRYGYNTIRYVFTWEAIEHAGPGKYDEEWIQHTISVLRIAKGYGFYVFMDPHQDVWSRFSGGSGAPLWTLYACGFDPKNFEATEAAIVHNVYPDPENYPKMIWSSNYTRLLSLTIFAMFWAGNHLTPKAIIDGKNIEDYLQDHYIAACEHLVKRVNEAGDLENEVIIGWESLNEPNKGLVAYQDISVIPSEQKFHKGTSPTAWQAILTGSGRACEIDTWDVGGMGPYKTGTALVDPKGVSAWVSTDEFDQKYGFKRDPGWKLGECIWAQHGVWDPETDTLLKKDYFAKDPETGETMDYEYFTNHYWLHHFRKWKAMVRKTFPETIIFCQPPVLEIPPSVKGTADDDPNMVFAPHFYDGITLLTKKWNRLWNIDIFGVLRHKYLTPAFAIKIGETAIRNCLRDQLAAISKEGTDHMGERPTIFTEIGIPYDMDDKAAYKTGDYTSQVLAMDANHFALEGSKVAGFTLWVYVATNSHKWGDRWNGEDLSIYSVDDQPLPLSPFSRNQSTASFDTQSPSYSQSQSLETSSVSPSTLKDTLSPQEMTPSNSQYLAKAAEKPGFRAAEAYVRPTPIATHGNLVSHGFDLRNCTFTLSLNAASPTPEDAPTQIFLPEFHFPPTTCSVQVSGGKWTISMEDDNGGLTQILRWWHAEGEQKMTVKGVKRHGGLVMTAEEEEGYLEQCQQRTCVAM